MSGDSWRSASASPPSTSAGTGRESTPLTGGAHSKGQLRSPTLGSSKSDSALGRLPSLNPHSKKTAVRQAVKLSVAYPDHKVLRPRPPRRQSALQQECARRRSSILAGEAPWQQEGYKKENVLSFVGCRGEEESAENGRRRSTFLMTNLHALRRLGNFADEARASEEGGSAEASRAASPKGQEQQEEPTLMVQILKDLQDTEESVKKLVDTLSAAAQPVHVGGGDRHPTAVIAARTLAVAKKKMQLCGEMESRIAGLEDAKARNAEIFQAVVGEGDVPSILLQNKKFLMQRIHHDPLDIRKECEPVDANKSDFDSFVSLFGLPPQHKTIPVFRKLIAEISGFWPEWTLEKSKEGADPKTIQRLIDASVAIGAERNNEKLVEAATLMGDRLGQATLALAQKLQDKDRTRQENSTTPQVGSAEEAAGKINQDIKEAIEKGAPNKHPDLEKAMLIAKELTILEVERVAQMCLHKAKEKAAKDAEVEERSKPKIPELGIASGFAEMIEREIQEAKDKGVREDNPALKESVAIVKALRDKDGERKRLLAREKRLSKMAEEKG
eukprot:gnl/TRDRNA2_/TRDRNA2_181381_c0_seq1.p1 gnl/TRDRNA2_/TRDRNA2_181381_c0~~gnl/TRDRNA2_/TRDRNA2_181381_c0_seq1.p1  ORF type:complete len:617 (-),score=147.53 gnl/TRDRNA2_/TRDRNA2_181381_c0_seq1:146-1816(-)